MRQFGRFDSARFSLILIACFAWSASATATTITLSDVSSDDTPAGQLDATYNFMITGASELTLTVTNTTDLDPGDNDAEFLMNGVWFNAASNVTNLTLDSATHSVAGDVFAAWTPVALGSMVDGYGNFDFGVDDGVGTTNPNLIGAGESIAFVFTITGTGPFDMSDFEEANAMNYSAAAMFVGCTGNDCVELDDSAFGAAVIPEPGTALLLGMGLLGLAAQRRSSTSQSRR
jgi:hypothetical protein